MTVELHSGFNIPSGLICLWKGSTANIPNGWFLCDGNNGTPNLLDRFIVAAGNLYAVGVTGGTNTHSHNVLGTSDVESSDQVVKSGVGISVAGINHTHGPGLYTTDIEPNIPLYYALAYIMKG